MFPVSTQTSSSKTQKKTSLIKSNSNAIESCSKTKDYKKINSSKISLTSKPILPRLKSKKAQLCSHTEHYKRRLKKDRK
jgi:hypothetical protein